MVGRFDREKMLLGESALERLANSRVALFGAGGVGCGAAEALARGGVGAIDIIDNDTVNITNINRQLCALESTIGRLKAEVVAERLRYINPEISARALPIFFMPDTELDFSQYDYIIDAIDTVTAKIEIAARAAAAGVPVISCMGTGNKLDATAFEVTDISKTSVCPLARVMRRELKARGISHIKVVYSKEEPHRPVRPEGAEGGKIPPASISFVPPVAGFIAAGEVIRDITENRR
ncbi:MAG: tRNA threonylcarbamoyladenosine dehydratase [Clostridia bacterium]|nr:tRNA threonylcarbamoyladenosine dehydratase [Clostridia bacterium]